MKTTEELSIGQEELLKIVLTNANQQIIKLNPIGGSDRYYEDNGDWGCGTAENPFELPEIIVTPDGNSWDDNWDDNWWNPNDDEWWNSNDDFSEGGGGGSVSNDAETINIGQYVIDAIAKSFDTGSALIIEFENTTTFKIISTTTFVNNIPSAQYDIISQAKGNPAFLKACGETLQKYNCIANGVVAAVGLFDGNVTVGDAINGMGALCGAAGFWMMKVNPVVGLTLDGISLVLTIAGAIVSANESNTSNEY